MSTKTISMCEGKGSLSHNNREFSAKNIDSSRTADNIVFVQQELGEVYDQLFCEAVERYNACQKRNDRKISDYFQHLFNRPPSASVITGANKQKSFYEDLVQIGTKDDTGVGTPDAEIAVACLREYMESFQKRNPNFYVFNAILHMDEARAELDKAAKKKVKLDEIEGIEAKESVFGKKVTLSKEDYDKLSDTAKKYVAMEKNIKKLKKERDTAVQELGAVMQKFEAVSSELSEYKKKEENAHYLSRKKLNAEAQRIKREDQLSRDLQKARVFISACGLAEDFARYKFNKTRNAELE